MNNFEVEGELEILCSMQICGEKFGIVEHFKFLGVAVTPHRGGKSGKWLVKQPKEGN